MSFRIAADIMGGDNSPLTLAGGAVSAGREFGARIILVCTEEVKNQLPYYGADVRVVTADCFVEMTDDPSVVMKEKKNASMCVACALCKNGEADAVVSAGNTGALFTTASLTVRRVKGVRRAALCSVIPLEKPFLMLDCGANLDATPEIMRLYARMGSIYAHGVLGVSEPRVALLNNGTEPHKGIPLYADTYKLLSEDKSINFIGNIEGKALPTGACDVLVCDGFTGNLVLKTIEGMGSFMRKTIKDIFSGGLLSLTAGALTLKKTKALKKRLDVKEYGGAPFLGLAKPVIKAHGSSNSYAFRSAVRTAIDYCACGAIDEIANSIKHCSEDAIGGEQ